MARPSDAKLREASAELLIFNPSPIGLPAGDDMLFTFDLVAQDPKFKDLAFGVMDYGETPTKTFLHNPDEVWNCGSTIKVALAAGAFALRRDVQSLRDKGFIADIQEADDIMRHIWSVADRAPIKNIGRPASFPIPSKVLEIRGAEVFFQGEQDPEDFDKLELWHQGKDGIDPTNLQKATFWERLILMIKASDNRAARAIQGALGIRYNVHVIEALGLFSDTTWSYGGLRPAGSYGSSPRYRDLGKLRQPEEYWNGWPKGRIFNGQTQKIPYGATPRACAGLMNAIVANTFINFISSRQFDHLLREEAVISVPSWAAEAIKTLGDVQAWTKVGVWANIAEFVRIETTDSKLKYGFIILGLPQTDPGTLLSEDLAKVIHHSIETIHA